jgi:hypothetical protein
VRRTILWLIGVTVLFWVTNGGPHFYQTSLFSAHALTQTMLTAVIPLLLVPAAPVALAELAIRGRTDGSTGMREVLTQVVPSRLIILARDPYMSALVLGGSLIVIYYRPFRDRALCRLRMAVLNAGISVGPAGGHVDVRTGQQYHRVHGGRNARGHGGRNARGHRHFDRCPQILRPHARP